ncbi:MAG: hypothetical protein IPK85_01485 [Gemmatimonadetes bacterium]|nr:hypothetical protein [Gemmatimonadota bacterium]
MHWTKDIALLTEQEERARQLGGRYGVQGVPIERDAMPSSYAVAAVINGEPGGIPRLVHVTFVRAAFMVPFVWGTSKVLDIAQLQKVRDMLLFSLGMSLSQSVGLLAAYKIKTMAANSTMPENV